MLAEVGLAERFARFDSPIGPLVVAWNGLGVSAVEAAPDDAAFEKRTPRGPDGRSTAPTAYRTDSLPPSAGDSPATGTSGSTSTCAATPTSSATSGTRRSRSRGARSGPYGWVAAEIGRPKAVRAVGTALGHNPVPLIVPCHRVVRTDGTLGQYSLGGPGNKRTILTGEGLDLPRLEGLAPSGIRFIGSDTTKVYCLPTCRYARRVTDRHRLEFHSVAEGHPAATAPARSAVPDRPRRPA